MLSSDSRDARFRQLDVYGDAQRTTRIFLWFIAGILAAQLAAIGAVLTNRDTVFALIIGASIPPVSAAFLLVRRRQFEWTAILLVVVLLTMITIVATNGLGIHHLSNLAIPVLLIIASLVTSRRTLAFLALAAMGCVAWLVFGELSGAYTPKVLVKSVPGDFLAAALAIVIAAVMSRVLVEAWLRNSAQLQQELKDRERAEAGLRSSEARFRAVVEYSHDGILFADASSTILYRSPSYVRINGYANEERVGHQGIETVHPEDADALRRDWDAMVGNPGSFLEKEYRILHRNGSWRWIQSSMQNCLDNPEVRAVVVTSRDITPQKEAVQAHDKLQAQLLQSQKMESVGRLAGGIAHDFNNLLSVILGNAEIALESRDIDPAVREGLHEIRKAAQHSAELTRKLLAFARRQDIVPRVVDLNEVVTGMLAMLQRLIGEDVRLLWEPGPDLWRVKMDPTQVEQVLANLSVNARDAIDGIGSLTVSTENVVADETLCRRHPGWSPGEFVLLKVCDTGEGMSPETLENIFEPFFTTKGIGKGTGLGLATVYGIVKQNNGFIDVSSEPGKGTTLWIYIPRTLAAADRVTVTCRGAPGSGNETVLVVEDEQGILTLVKTALEKKGYTVLTAGSPGDALSQVRRHEGPLHLLLTDVVMPDMSGKDLHKRVAAIRPAIKVLFMSGHTADVIARRGIMDEGTPFLQKPFLVQALCDRVREALDLE